MSQCERREDTWEDRWGDTAPLETHAPGHRPRTEGSHQHDAEGALPRSAEPCNTRAEGSCRTDSERSLLLRERMIVSKKEFARCDVSKVKA